MDSSSRTNGSAWLHQIAGLLDDAGDEAATRRELDRATVQRLYEEVARLAHVDARRAAEIAELATKVAEVVDDDSSRGLARKATGFLSYLATDYEEALEAFEEAAELFSRQGEELEYAATLNTSLQTLSYLGRYPEAYAAAREARRVFEAHGEELKLARLDSNEGNILFRQERIDEAQTRYRAALKRLRRLGAAPQDVAAAMHNIITCGIAQHDFDGSLAVYGELLELCDRHDMAPVAAQAEYNIAYLHFLRGDYSQALELYQDARERAHAAGDRYHEALCDLDQSEMLLELNMRQEGARLGTAALGAFEEIGLGYEAAKAITFMAIAASQEGKAIEALDLFRQARQRFEGEGNDAWVSVIDLYRAVIYHDEKRPLEARKLALAALGFFSATSLASKTVICELVLARVALQSGEVDEAGRRVAAASERMKVVDRPALGFRVHLVAAEVAEAEGNLEAARESLSEAVELLENLRSHLRGEELKLAFLRDKTAVYEHLVWLSMARPLSEADKESVFLNMERSKSRTLADLVTLRGPGLPAASAGSSRLVDRMHRLRNELNWYYRQIDLQEIRSASRASGDGTVEPVVPDRLRQLYERSRKQEDQLIASLADLRAADVEFSSLQTAAILDLPAIRRALPPRTMLLEYFVARDTVFCCCLGPSSLEVRPLTTATLVREEQQRLSFQLGKFRLGSAYTDKFADTLERSTRSHLEALERELVAPIRDDLDADHLIIVPHGSLHSLPFHAFHGEAGYLIDDFTISYAPSANVYALCAGKTPSSGTSSLILGVPAADAPGIRDEAEAVADALPQARLFLGRDATEARLRRDGAGARHLHIATHGLFRQDNPMFSSIQLGASRLTLFDLYSLELDADLVVLSGCSTGVSVVEGGDELIGLSRGLLYAGARSVMASLWDVHDESTVGFMDGFYRSLLESRSAARALRNAMRAVRASHPHPYYWAPFVLVGQYPSAA